MKLQSFNATIQWRDKTRQQGSNSPRIQPLSASDPCVSTSCFCLLYSDNLAVPFARYPCHPSSPANSLLPAGLSDIDVRSQLRHDPCPTPGIYNKDDGYIFSVRVSTSIFIGSLSQILSPPFFQRTGLFMSVRLIIPLALAWAATALPGNHSYSNSSCRVLPGDTAWPNAQKWASLNGTLNGRLIASVPESSVCHNSPFNDYDAAACAVLQKTWNDTEPAQSVLILFLMSFRPLSNASVVLVQHQKSSARYFRITHAFRTRPNPSPVTWAIMPVTW